mmetsp:Transcript_19293/g.46598  ORF Transcript_19293/g.46598 Transcript_19293/m.46598 type:complete len:319 (+) Transcript_19293:112-1068(+)
MAATFDSEQAGMAFFLLICTFFNIWFLYVSGRRVFASTTQQSATATTKTPFFSNLKSSVFIMALFDIPWVWLCAIQCLYNTFTTPDSFHQSSGEDSFGCKFMGWYSSFSMVSMMGSNCLVAFYLSRHLQATKTNNNDNDNTTVGFLDRKVGLFSVTGLVLTVACLFASMPLIQGDGYLYTTGGFCYADFTQTTQSSIMLTLVILLLGLSTTLWVSVGFAQHWYFYGVFFVTWILWIPACIYGIQNGSEIAYPYMLVGAIIGHSNALINPLLYGLHLFHKLALGENVNNKNQIVESSSDEEKALKSSTEPATAYGQYSE